MATDMRCMGCMKPLQSEGTTCSCCGYPVSGINPPEYLPVRTLLSGRYLVGRVLEIGGDSAVYIGFDQQENCTITLREFFSSTLCTRQNNGEVTVLPECAETFLAYRSKFLSVARSVARLRDLLVVVPAYDIFEENGTAYSVMEFCEGRSLEKYVAEKGGHLSFEEARRLFLPLLSALSSIHATGMLHLGISPKNVLVDNAGRLRIKNFAIEETRTANSKCQPSMISGYAAPEQYEAGAVCTPASDVYGVAATLFFALTGRRPTDANKRGKKAEELLMPAQIADKTPTHVKESLIRALREHPQRRTQTIQQLLDELTATSAVAALIHEDDQPSVKSKKGKKHYLWVVFTAVFAVLAVVVAVALNGLGVIELPLPANSTTTQDSMTTTTTPVTTVPVQTGPLLFGTEDVCGRMYAVVRKSVLSGDMTVALKGYEYSETVPRGAIISQTPAPNEKVERGTTIQVVISAGRLNNVMPDMTGWEEEHAKLYLEALGYTVTDSLLLQVSTLEKGLVESTSPKAGETILPGDTVTLYVSDVTQ